MGITISGENNNDRILASDGVIDSLSGFNVVGVMTASSFSGNLIGDVTGNLTGNVNHTSNLLLQIGGSEKFRVGSSGQLGIGGANYGTSGQVLQSAGSGAPPTWNTISGGVTSDGSQNTVGGSNAGDSIVGGGTENTVFGYNSGTAITTGDNNTFFGSRSGRSVSTNVNNTGVGYNVMGNASGSGNAAVGRDAGNGMGDGINHVAIGYAAFSNTNQIGTQQNNIVIGYNADVSSSTVSNEITLGNSSITKLRVPGINVVLKDNGGTPTQGHVLTVDGSGEAGFAAASGGGLSSDGQENTVGGTNAGNALTSNATSNTFLGAYSGRLVDTGDRNTAVGRYTFYTATGASDNVSIGYNSLYATTGNDNTAIGSYSGRNISSGVSNVTIGKSAGDQITTGSNNTFAGHQAGASYTTESDCTAFGYQVMQNATAPGNYAFGRQALRNNTSNGYNCAFGRWSLKDSTDGQRNSGFGNYTLRETTSGSYNTAVGYDSSRELTTGSGNCTLGYRAGDNIITGSNNIVIGNDINASASDVSNEITLGNTSINKFRIPGVNFEITSSEINVTGATDGVINLNTTDSRGSFIRYQVNGTSKCFVGCGQGLGLGAADDLGLRATNDIRMRSGSEEHAVLTADGYFAAKGMAGNWSSSNTHPASSQYHQFVQTGTGKRIMVLRQEHHAGLGVEVQMTSTGNSEALYITGNGSIRFRVLSSGNVANTNNSYGSLSDVSLKENIVDANSQWDDIKAVKVRNFNLKDDTDKVKMLGVVAQELATISPNLVWEDKEGLKGVSYSVLYMKAMKCLQEAQARIETLEAKVSALEGS